MENWKTYPSCPKCDATDYVYRGTRGNEDDPCEVFELREGEPCVCHHHIEECRWRPLPGHEKAVLVILDGDDGDDGIEDGAVITMDIAGAPYRIGERVRVKAEGDDETFDPAYAGRVGTVVGFVKDCGATFPADPYIRVAGVDGPNGCWQDGFWKDEIEPYTPTTEELDRAREKAAQAKDALLAALAAIDGGDLADAYRHIDTAHDRTYEALCAVQVDGDGCLYQGHEYTLPPA